MEYYVDLKQYFKSVFVMWNEKGIIVGSILDKQMIFRAENKEFAYEKTNDAVCHGYYDYDG